MSIFSFFKRKRIQATSKKSEGKLFRRDIQALRALAVAAVVLYHLWPDRLVGGFAGVDIFFVISGFLMTTSIVGRLKPHVDTGSLTVKNILRILANFYARRISRLVPAALAALAGVLILAYLTNNLTIMVNTAKNVISSATFWQNWHLAQQSIDYLHAGDTPVATEHFWSLSLEEQFYLMWPLLLVLSALLTINVVVYYRKHRISGMILPISLLTMMSFAYGYWLTQTEPSVAYFSTPARIWELMLGGIIAFLPTIKKYDLKLLLPHLGLAMCLYSLFFITGDGFPGWHALIPTLGTALIIWSGTGKAESQLSFENLFSWKPIQWIGNISYSIYLWHFPLIVLIPAIIHHSIDGPHGRLIKCGIIVFSLIAAQLSYTYIEETTRKIRLKLRYIYLLFVIATGLVVCGGIALQKYGTTQVDVRLSATHLAALDDENICFGARATLHRDECGNPYGKINSDYISVGTADTWGKVLSNQKQCYLFSLITHDTDPDSYCTLGDEKSKRYVVFLGDSHAEQYINTVDKVGKNNKLKFIMINLGTCTTWTIYNESSECKERYNFLNSSGLLDESSFVLVSSAYKSYFDISELLKLVKSESNRPVYLVKDIPRYTSTLLNDCYTIQTSCSRPISDAMDIVNNISDQLIENSVIKRSRLIDLTSAYCDDTRCYASVGGVPVYYNTRDEGKGRSYYNSHTNQSYSLSMSNLLEAELAKRSLLP